MTTELSELDDFKLKVIKRVQSHPGACQDGRDGYIRAIGISREERDRLLAADSDQPIKDAFIYMLGVVHSHSSRDGHITPGTITGPYKSPDALHALWTELNNQGERPPDGSYCAMPVPKDVAEPLIADGYMTYEQNCGAGERWAPGGDRYPVLPKH